MNELMNKNNLTFIDDIRYHIFLIHFSLNGLKTIKGSFWPLSHNPSHMHILIKNENAQNLITCKPYENYKVSIHLIKNVLY